MGLTMSFPKTKLLVAGASCGEEDRQPIHIGGETIEAMSSFRYLGSVLESHGEIRMDVEDGVARASRAFGALCRPVFCNGSLSRKIKRMVYHATVLDVLLYELKLGQPRVSTQKVEAFNNRCLRHIMNISMAKQRAGYISSVQMRRNFGMDEALEDVVIARRLRWLGHVARMQEDRIPKRLLFGWFTHRRPMHGCKLRWRDRVRKDLKRFKIDEGKWYRDAKERDIWRAQCREGLDICTKERFEDRIRKEAASTIDRHDTSSNTATTPFVCDTCHRSFRRQDIARHKCQMTRYKGATVIV